MKKINIMAVTLSVISKAELPTFHTASAKRLDMYPGVFSIEKATECGPDWYRIQVSPSSIMEAMCSVQAMASAQSAAKFEFQTLKEKTK